MFLPPSFSPVVEIGTNPAPASASIASIVRIPYAYGILDNPEYLYTYEPIAAWSTVEIGIGLTASSLATLTPLFRRIRIFKGSTGATNPAAGPGGGAGSHYLRGGRGAHDVLPSADKTTGVVVTVVGGVGKGGDSDVEALKRQPSDEIELYPYGGRRNLRSG